MNLTKAQEEIVNAPMGPILVTAGAGSGKTRALTHRLLHLIESGVPDYQIVALTFTNKAGNEMRIRVEKLLGRPFNTFIGTFHSFCVRILRKNGFAPNFSIYSSADTNKVLKEVIKEIAGEESSAKNNAELLKKANYHLSEWKNKLIDLDKYYCDAVSRQILTKYQEKLKQNNAMDFDDLLLNTVRLLKSRPDVRKKLQIGFSYILVDEFQDTNEIQYKIVADLAKLHKNIMAVGDEDQCIYTWRGASAENITRFKNDFPDFKIYKLEENFRSSKNIVDLASALVDKNTNRIKKTLFSQIPDGKINFNCYYNENQEADRIVEKIIRHKQNGGKYRDIAILMRINALSRVFEERLRTYGIPYAVWGGFKFYERAEVKTALDYLRVITNPKDNVAFFNVINFPRRGIGDLAVEKIKSGALLTGKAKTGYEAFLKVISELKEAGEKGLTYLADNFIDITGLYKHYEEDKTDGENRLENLYQLIMSIKEFAAANPGADLSNYLQTVSVAGAEDPNAEEHVVISTVHSAKGLEFNTVFIVGLEDGLFPSYRAGDDKDRLEEERRLLYVAITRTMRDLNISFVKMRYLNGETARCRPSVFIAELGYDKDDCCDDFSLWF